MWQLLLTLVFAVKRLLPRTLRQAFRVVPQVVASTEISVPVIPEAPAIGLLAAGWCPRRLMAEESDPFSKTICSRLPAVLRRHGLSERGLPEQDLRIGSHPAMSLGRLLSASAA